MITGQFLSEKPIMRRYESVDSTNSVMRSLTDAPHGTVVTAREQTAGRGQRGNSWEAAAGENVTMTIMLHPKHISARNQFVISEIVAVSVANILDMLAGKDAAISVKWPNDIYAGDKKIAGILIENTLAGTDIVTSMAGIGININQERFMSDAPNPVSLYQLTGLKQNPDAVARLVAEEILSLFRMYDSSDAASLHADYLSRLWRSRGVHPYRDAASGETFLAAIQDVTPEGPIILRRTDGRVSTYAFKEVAALL